MPAQSFCAAGAREIDRGLAVHARRRGHVGIQLVAGNDAHTVMLPAFRAIVRVRGVIVRFGHVVTKSLIALASGTPNLENHQRSPGASRYRQVLR